MIVPSEENVVLAVLSPGQHHVDTVVQVKLLVVENDVRVAAPSSQNECEYLSFVLVVNQRHLPLHVDSAVPTEIGGEPDGLILVEPTQLQV